MDAFSNISHSIPGGAKAMSVTIKGDAASLKLGEVVKGVVSELTGEDTAKIRLKGAVVEVKTNIKLTPGETLNFKVEPHPKGIKGQVSLRLVDGEAAKTEASAKGEAAAATGAKVDKLPPAVREVITTAMAALKGAKLDSAALTTMKSFIEKLPPGLAQKIDGIAELKGFFNSIEGLTGENLKETLKNSGLFLESKLKALVLQGGEGSKVQGDLIARIMKGDLKGILMRVGASLTDKAVIEELIKAGIKPGDMAGVVERLGQGIEFQQLQSRSVDTLQLFFPFLWTNLKDGTLVMGESYRGPAEEKSYSCTVTLDLEETGRVRAFILYSDGPVHVSFTVEDESFKRLIEENSDALREGLINMGLEPGAVRVERSDDIEMVNLPDGEGEGGGGAEGFKTKA